MTRSPHTRRNACTDKVYTLNALLVALYKSDWQIHKCNANVFIYEKKLLLRTEINHEKGFTRPSACETDIGCGYYKHIFLYI